MPRPAGSPDKPKRRFLARLEDDFPGYHPVIELIRMVQDEELDAPLRAKIHADVAKYCVPQLKAIEHTGADGGPLQVITGVATDSGL